MATLKPKARAKFIHRLELLQAKAYRILENRNAAAYLRDDIYEIRFKSEGVGYRALFFFDGQDVCMISHGITKDSAEVPPAEIEGAIKNRTKYLANRERHTYSESWG